MKNKKWLIIGAVVICLGIVGNLLPDSKVEDSSNKTEPVEEVSKVASITTDELIERLDGYETMYSNHIENFAKVAEEGDHTKMKDSFVESKDAASATFAILSDLKKEFDSSSNEYKAINELQTAFNSLKDACDDGANFIVTNDSKDLEKYESNMKQSDLFLQRYIEVKESLKQ